MFLNKLYLEFNWTVSLYYTVIKTAFFKMGHPISATAISKSVELSKIQGNENILTVVVI